MNIERADYVTVNLSPKNPFGLTFPARDKNRSLFIEEPVNFGAGTSESAQNLARTLLVAHLIIKHFPKKIETNFSVDHKVFLDEVYGHYGYKPPKIIKGHDQIKPEIIRPVEEKKQKILYANAHSGGLDSLYRLAKLLSEDKGVLVAHLRNLNPKGNYREAVASRKHADILGIPYEEIHLRNGTDNSGFDVMRTRDMFLGLLVAVVAEPYGVKKVLIEGNMETTPNAHFTDYAPAWKFFNQLLKEVGLHSQVEGVGGL